MGHEAGNKGHLVVGGDVDSVGEGRGERGAEEAEEEQSGSPQECVHGRILFDAQSNEPEKQPTSHNHINNTDIRPEVSK